MAGEFLDGSGYGTVDIERRPDPSSGGTVWTSAWLGPNDAGVNRATAVAVRDTTYTVAGTCYKPAASWPFLQVWRY